MKNRERHLCGDFAVCYTVHNDKLVYRQTLNLSTGKTVVILLSLARFVQTSKISRTNVTTGIAERRRSI